MMSARPQRDISASRARPERDLSATSARPQRVLKAATARPQRRCNVRSQQLALDVAFTAARNAGADSARSHHVLSKQQRRLDCGMRYEHYISTCHMNMRSQRSRNATPHDFNATRAHPQRDHSTSALRLFHYIYIIAARPAQSRRDLSTICCDHSTTAP